MHLCMFCRRISIREKINGCELESWTRFLNIFPRLNLIVNFQPPEYHRSISSVDECQRTDAPALDQRPKPASFADSLVDTGKSKLEHLSGGSEDEEIWFLHAEAMEKPTNKSLRTIPTMNFTLNSLVSSNYIQEDESST